MNRSGNEYGSTLLAHLGQFELVNIRSLCRNDFSRRAIQERPVKSVVWRRIDSSAILTVEFHFSWTENEQQRLPSQCFYSSLLCPFSTFISTRFRLSNTVLFTADSFVCLHCCLYIFITCWFRLRIDSPKRQRQRRHLIVWSLKARQVKEMLY